MNARTRLLGVDYGCVRLGLALCDAERRLASPLAVYERQGRERDADYFRALVQREEIGAIVVGLPVHCDGREGAKAAEARSFGMWLAEATGLAVKYWDERFSTVEAESAMWQAGFSHKKRKTRRDCVAAQIILQTYLDAGCPDRPVVEPLEG